MCADCKDIPWFFRVYLCWQVIHTQNNYNAIFVISVPLASLWKVFHQILFACNIGLSIQLLGKFCRLGRLHFAPQLFGCVFEFNFNNKLCALLSYSATRHGIVEKSSRNVKACRSRGLAPPDFGRLVNPISSRGADYVHHITPRFFYPPTAIVW